MTPEFQPVLAAYHIIVPLLLFFILIALVSGR